ncbi:MAG TPA: Ig-like domain-containing protein, partial [Acidimicrobiales bacterium]|nr:Ig-like domain-containing protein [Acidimicrobiales bacterium]
MVRGVLLGGLVALGAAALAPVGAALGATPTWRIASSPNAGSSVDNQLLGVAALAPNNVWAVGYYNAGTSTSPVYQTLVEHFNGVSWSVVPSPNATTTSTNELTAVSADAPNDVWAVGYYNAGTASSPVYQTLAEHYNGTSWSLSATPDVSTTQSETLTGVAAVSASDVWAVGSYYSSGTPSTTRTLLMQWNGTAWALVPDAQSPDPGSAANVLNGAAAASASDVWAVGYQASSGPDQTLAANYNGLSWSPVATPNASATGANVLNAVAAASASDVWAVGYASNGTVDQTLVEQYNGTSWSVVSSPDANTTGDNVLSSVAVDTASDVWAVGYYNAGTSTSPVYQTLIEHYDGTSWSVVSSPDTSSSATNVLSGVAVASAASAWTVGHAESGTGSSAFAQTLTETTALSSTTTLASSANPSVTGQSVTYTATVAGSGPTPTGTVQFLDGGTPIGGCSSVALSGSSASCQVTYPGVGSHSVVAVYGGDSNYLGSTSSPVSQVVNQDSTTTSLSSSANPVAPSTNVTYTAKVTANSPGGGTPTGTVAFLDAGSPITGCTAQALSAGVATCTVSYPAAGSHSVTASYSGDANYSSSASTTLNEAVVNPPTVTVASSANPSVTGQPVTYTATVTGGTTQPTGTVSFSDGGTPVPSCQALALSSGSATCQVTYSGVGSHSIVASYSGDSNYPPSSSAALTQTVNQAATTTALSSSANPSVTGQSVTYTATVAASAPGSGTPTGTVSFS